MTEYKPPRAPGGLARAGRAMWRNVVTGWELREDELRVLESACRLLDEIDRLQEALEAAPVMVPGSRGNSRVNPLFTEVRNHRLALSKLLTALGIPDEETGDRSSRRSQTGREMAMIRWGRRNG